MRVRRERKGKGSAAVSDDGAARHGDGRVRHTPVTSIDKATPVQAMRQKPDE